MNTQPSLIKAGQAGTANLPNRANQTSFAGRLGKLTAACALALLTAACGSLNPFSSSTSAKSAGDAKGSLNTQSARITDETILADRRTIESLQGRLAELNKAGVPVKSYNFAKAQCWLDTAKTQYHENDRTGYIEESLEQSIGLIRTMDANRSAAALSATPLVAGSHKLRDDLWARLNGFKTQRGFECAAQTVACAEVRLVRAGHASEQTGWRQANPHIGMVEDAIKLAEREAAACNPPSIAAVTAPLPARPNVPAPLPAPAPVGAAGERFVLLSDTLFKFDKSDLGNMLPGGRIRLNAVVAQLRKYERIERLEVLGFTDRLGSDQYNAALSAARAATVRDYLASQGVRADAMSASGRGKANSMSGACSDRGSRSDLIACLQPDRRVEIEVYGVARR
jgi:OmpA-OmpF porin, OOP family